MVIINWVNSIDKLNKKVLIITFINFIFFLSMEYKSPKGMVIIIFNITSLIDPDLLKSKSLKGLIFPYENPIELWYFHFGSNVQSIGNIVKNNTKHI